MNKYICLSLALLFNVIDSRMARATHIAAAEITYAYTGTPNTWLLTAKLYRDASLGTATLGPTANICYSSASLNFFNSIVLQLISGSGSLLPASPCIPVGQGTPYEEYIYQGLVTLPGTATDWRFSWTSCCRNGAICNIQTPLNQGMIITSGLNSAIAPTNSSPVFSYIPINRFCVNSQFYYPMGATDVDGDSLVFQLTDCEDGTSCASILTTVPIPWVAPFSATDPFPTLNGVSIDSNTGLIQFYPTNCCVYNIAVQCNEYRNGVQIGYIRRDLQINVVCNCTNTPPGFSNLVLLPGGLMGINANCGDTVIRVYFNQQIQCGSVTPNDLRVTEPNGFPNPVTAINPVGCISGLSDTMDVHIYNGLKAGISWLYTKVGNDGNTFITVCGVEMNEFDSIPIFVADTAQLIPPLINIPSCSFASFTTNFNLQLDCSTIAQNLSDFTLTDAMGTNVPILSINSNCQPGNPWSYVNTITFNIAPATYVPPLYLTVKNGTDGNTIANACGSLLGVNDTLAVIDFFTDIPVNLGPDQTVCETTPPVLNAGYPGSTYVWSFNGAPTGDTTQTITASQTGTYSVFVSLSSSCTGSDTMSVTLVSLPQPSLGNDITICSTDPLPVLDCNVSGAASYQWLLNGSIIPAATGQTYQATGAGTYTVIVSTATNCDATDTLELIIQASLPVALGNDQTLCANDPSAVLNAGVTAAMYQWYLNGTAISGGTNQTYTVTQTGTYACVATSSSGCTGSDTAFVQINAVPVISLGPDTTVCILAGYQLNAQNSGATYQWLLNGSPLPGETQQTYTPTQTGVYGVTVTNSNNCTETGYVNITVVNQAAAPTPVSASYCEGDPVPVLDAGVTNVDYQWYDGNNNAIPGETNQTYQPTGPGVYTVVVSINGACTNSGSATITQYSTPQLSYTSTYAADPTHNGIHLCDEDNLQITVSSNPAASSYVWTYTAVGGTAVVLSNTTASYQVPQHAYGDYEIEITDQNGCENRIEIEVEEECELVFYNVITPNGDGNNDNWVIENFDPSVTHTLKIYNRWGNEVYSTSSYQNDWNGADLPNGVYYYILQYNGQGYTGNITRIQSDKK